MSEWRIYVYDCDGNGNITLVDSDLRASAQPTRELNASGSVSLTVKPEQDIDLRPWRSLIVVELDGSIRGTGLVSDMADDGDGSLSVTCVGPTGWWDNEPADMNKTYRDTDPARIIRDMYSWAQNRAGFKMGMDFASYVDSGVRVGNPDPPVTKPVLNVRPKKMQSIPPEPQKSAYPNYYLKGNKPAQVQARNNARVAYRGAMSTWREIRNVRTKANKAEDKRYKDQMAEYKKALDEYNQAIIDALVKIQWWENPTVGGVVDDMAKYVDYKVVPRWVNTELGKVPDHKITIDKHIGGRKNQLRFVVGENVVDAPPVDWAGESYATKVVFLGSGEGEKMIRGTATGSRGNGLARTVFISDKSVRSKSLADKRAAKALAWRQKMPLVTELKIMDDDNAPFGSFDVGDEIRLIDNSGRWAGSIDMWVRILSITESTDAPIATLTVVRSDQGE